MTKKLAKKWRRFACGHESTADACLLLHLVADKNQHLKVSRTVAALPAAGRPRSYVHQLVKPDPVLYLLSVCPVL